MAKAIGWGLLAATVLLLPARAWAKPAKKPLVFIDLGMGVGETYDDNVYQQNFFAEDDFITQVAPSVSVDIGAIRWLKLKATYSPIYRYFAFHHDLNQLLHKLDFDLGVDLGQEKRFRNFRVSTEVQYTPVSVSVLSSANSSINTTQRLTLAVAPGYLWEISPLWDVDFALRFQRQMYFGPGADSTSGDGAITIRRRILRRIFLRAGGNTTYQKFDNIGDTKIYGVSGGVDLEISRRLNASFTAGYQIIDLPSNSGQNKGGYGDALTIGANLDYAITKRTSFVLDFNRANTVDLNGNDFLSTRGTLSIRHRLSAKTLVSLSGYYQQAVQDRPQGELLLQDKLDTVGGTLRYQFAQNWTVSGNVTYDRNRGSFNSDDYTQHRYTLELRYHYPIVFK